MTDTNLTLTLYGAKDLRLVSDFCETFLVNDEEKNKHTAGPQRKPLPAYKNNSTGK